VISSPRVGVAEGPETLRLMREENRPTRDARLESRATPHEWAAPTIALCGFDCTVTYDSSQTDPTGVDSQNKLLHGIIPWSLCFGALRSLHCGLEAVMAMPGPPLGEEDDARTTIS
jgi:hypothetical protein